VGIGIVATNTDSTFNPDKFQFRGLHRDILIGMASDRYAGWIGQVYSEGNYDREITRRSHAVGGKNFEERVLPVRSVEEYFDHFPVLEIDYTFYRLLLNADGTPTQNYHVLGQYRQHMKEGDGLVLKVPQVISARRLRRGKGMIENEAYLDADMFTKRFCLPATEILGPLLRGFIFEQEYHVKKERMDVVELAGALDVFFNAIPKDKRYHMEFRTEAYWAEPVFNVLRKHGVGLVLSHWTWLPSLGKQFEKTEGRFFRPERDCIVRLITPLRMRYEESYGKAFPFDKMVDGMLNPQMVEDMLRLMWEAIKHKVQMIIIINNRAGGNAPLIAKQIAERFLSRQA
jgi:uncharacterized protein YecE (DUF72 family)